MRAVHDALLQERATAKTVSPPEAPLSSPDYCFTYNTLDGGPATLLNCRNVNSYVFHAERFASVPYPRTWPQDRVWPPKTIADLCSVPDMGSWPCAGDKVFLPSTCRDDLCKHTLEDWISATKDWGTHFELRETADRGIGVFAKQDIPSLSILGWYTGELLVHGRAGGSNDYALALPIGEKPQSAEPHYVWTRGPRFYIDKCKDKLIEEATIEAEKVGNWTRFINHSCDANTTFANRCVGSIRIMAVKSKCSIAAGEELTIHYGDTYFGSRTCRCGAVNCLEENKGKDESQVQHDGT